jgi:nucleoside-diphosphate-sugar epimerase
MVGLRVLVTGASGFIGSSLCASLRAAGMQVSGVSLRKSLPALHGVEAVVHLAAIAHRAATPLELQRVNVELCAAMARAAAAAGAHFVFLSSVKVHGEESRAPLTESCALAPADSYARSKAEAEATLRAVPGLRLLVLRPPLVYGPGVKANFRALLRAVARGLPLPFARVRNRRSLLYVGNLGAALHQGLRQGLQGTYLLSDGDPVSTPELCRRLAAALGRRARLLPVSPRLLELLPGSTRLTRSLELDDTALRRALGWQPPYGMDQGLCATIRELR